MKFTHRDVGADESARRELVGKLGRMATPTLLIDGRVFLGFKQNREEIEKIIRKIVEGES